jgi:hypothetical protein
LEISSNSFTKSGLDWLSGMDKDNLKKSKKGKKEAEDIPLTTGKADQNAIVPEQNLLEFENGNHELVFQPLDNPITIDTVLTIPNVKTIDDIVTYVNGDRSVSASSSTLGLPLYATLILTFLKEN